MYEVEEIVTLSAARGGWQGVISRVQTIGDRNAYLVHSLKYVVYSRLSEIVLEQDIASSQGFAYPTWNIGDTVILYKRSGTITAIDGTEYTVEIDIPIPDLYFTRKRFHKVPRWRLLIENNG